MSGVGASTDVTTRDDERLVELLEHAKRTNADLPEPLLPPVTTCEVNGITVHHLDSDMTIDGVDREFGEFGEPCPTFVLVHGLGGSFASWEPLWDFLTPHGRVLAPDLAGFGRTQADVAATSVGANVELLASYLRRLGVGPVVLVGNSMGGMIAAMLTARHPDLVERLVLVDPVLPLHLRTLPHWDVAAVFALYLCSPLARFVIPRYAEHRGLEGMGADSLLNVVADPHRVPRWAGRRAIEETIAYAEIQGAVSALARAAQSLVIAAGTPGYRSTLASLVVPVTLLHGDADHLVRVVAARVAAARHPRWRYVEGHDVGHVPMFEVAEWVSAQILHG